MCGLLGMAGNGLGLRHREAFKELLYVSALRGRDGTGLMAVNTRASHEHLRIVKAPIEANDYLHKHGTRAGILSSSMYNIMMAHTRWATVGAVNSKNVHPFDMGSFVGAHNGTLEGIEFWKQGKTDSEVMFETMLKKGVIPTLESIHYHDAFAISMYEKGTGKLSLVTNGRRPLAVAVCKDSDAIFWASEVMMLWSILDRNHIDAEVYRLNPYTMYEIQVDDVKVGNAQPWETTQLAIPKKPVAPKISSDAQAYYERAFGAVEVLDDKIPF